MTRDKLEALKKLDRVATAGPWLHDAEYSWYHGGIYTEIGLDGMGVVGTEVLAVDDEYMTGDVDNGKLICAARNSLPQLLRIAEAAIEMMESDTVKGLMKDWAVFDKLAVAIGGDDDK